eukprot:jgi/Botrbrau1/22510/Bobra.114_2s0035.1
MQAPGGLAGRPVRPPKLDGAARDSVASTAEPQIPDHGSSTTADQELIPNQSAAKPGCACSEISQAQAGTQTRAGFRASTDVAKTGAAVATGGSKP